jgi:DNA-binding CsgD family transcriptional regulator
MEPFFKNDPLTAREAEIVMLMAEDMTAFQIADRLDISERTVATHKNNAYPKLGVHTGPGAVAVYLRFLGSW